MRARHAAYIQPRSEMLSALMERGQVRRTGVWGLGKKG